MGKTLVITEKPSVAREYAQILSVNGGKKDGYIENDNYIISWCVGHLITMSYPEKYDETLKKWSLSTLPFLPKEYKYEVIGNVKKQYEIVKTLLNRNDVDEILWAGDPAREGQYIENLIRDQAGVNPNAVEKRVWIDSTTEEEIRRGIKDARPMSDYDNLAASGYMRAIEDYSMGINFSRVLSVQYGKELNDAAGTKTWKPVAVGRVMTCVLGMIVKREREIREFTETPFFKILATLKSEDTEFNAEWKAVEGSKYYASPILYKDNGFLKDEDASKFIADLKECEKAVVKTIEKKVEKKNPPMLFNLAELQAECSKKFKISPDETLAIAQELYEKKLTTYPRTDARVLSTAIATEIDKNLRGLCQMPQVSGFAAEILNGGLYKGIVKSKYTDDSKISDHYAIIPTGQGLKELTRMSETACAVYLLICKRFLACFYPPAVYNKHSLSLDILGEEFNASLKVLKDEGYLKLYASDIQENTENPDGEKEDEEEQTVGNAKQQKKLGEILSKFKKGDEISISDFTKKEGKTTPPKRYTSGSMILAMENAGQLIEDETLREQIKGSGIGTSATRAEILKKLIAQGYIRLNKKTQALSPEKLGEMVYEIVALTIPSLLNPKLTASWEKGLTQVASGVTTKEEYLKKLEDFVRTKTTYVIGHGGKEKGMIIQRFRYVSQYYK